VADSLCALLHHKDAEDRRKVLFYQECLRVLPPSLKLRRAAVALAKAAVSSTVGQTSLNSQVATLKNLLRVAVES
jgi:hypothetical protein